MVKRFYILSRYKLPTLATGPGDLVLEDIIDIASDKATRVIDSESSIRDLKRRHPELRYCFSVEVQAL